MAAALHEVGAHAAEDRLDGGAALQLQLLLRRHGGRFRINFGGGGARLRTLAQAFGGGNASVESGKEKLWKEPPGWDG